MIPILLLLVAANAPGAPATNPATSPVAFDAEQWQRVERAAHDAEASGDYAAVAIQLERAVALSQALDDRDPRKMGAIFSLARVYAALKRYDDATKAFTRAVALGRINERDRPLDLAGVLRKFAEMYTEQDRHADAEATYRQLIAVLEKALLKNDQDVIIARCSLAVVLSAQGKFTEAADIYEGALASMRQTRVPRDLTAVVLDLYAAALVKQGKLDQAQLKYHDALDIFEATLGEDHPKVAACLGEIGQLYVLQGKPALAEPVLRRSLRIYQRTLRQGDPNFVPLLEALAKACTALNNPAEAEALTAHARAIREVHKMSPATTRSTTTSTR